MFPLPVCWRSLPLPALEDSSISRGGGGVWKWIAHVTPGQKQQRGLIPSGYRQIVVKYISDIRIQFPWCLIQTNSRFFSAQAAVSIMDWKKKNKSFQTFCEKASLVNSYKILFVSTLSIWFCTALNNNPSDFKEIMWSLWATIGPFSSWRGKLRRSVRRSCCKQPPRLFEVAVNSWRPAHCLGLDVCPQSCFTRLHVVIA